MLGSRPGVSKQQDTNGLMKIRAESASAAGHASGSGAGAGAWGAGTALHGTPAAISSGQGPHKHLFRKKQAKAHKAPTWACREAGKEQ